MSKLLKGRWTPGKVLGIVIISTFLVLLISNMAYPWLQSGIESLLGITPGPPEEEFFYTGNLKVNVVMYDVYDDSVVTPTGIVTKIWHADESTVFGSVTMDGSDSITGQVIEEDKGILYLSVDHAATTIYYMVDGKSEQASGAFLTALDPKDVDDDGTFEHYFKLDVTKLTPLEAGETQKEITVNLYALDADVTGLNIASITNPSSADLSGSAYVDLFAEAYVDAVTQGDGFKLVRVELTMPDAANETYYEDGKVKNVWVSIRGGEDVTYKWTTLSWQPGQDRFLVWEASDVTQEIYGKDVIYDRNMGATEVGRIVVHIQGANFAASAVWNPTIKLTFIDPAGTISTDTLAITFTDT